jgi:hypothetical protein
MTKSDRRDTVLKQDNIRRMELENWEVDKFGQDLSYYDNAFAQADQLNL